MIPEDKAGETAVDMVPERTVDDDADWTIAQLLKWAERKQKTIVGWKSEGISPAIAQV